MSPSQQCTCLSKEESQGKLNFKCKYELAYSQNVHAGNETIEHIWSLLNSSEGYKGCYKRRLQFEWQKPAKSSPNVICLPLKDDTLKLKGKHHLKSLNLKTIVDLHARYTITQHHSMLNHIPNHNPQTPSLTTRLSTKTAQSQHKDTTNGCRWAIESRNNQAHNAKAKKTSAHSMAVGERTPWKNKNENSRATAPTHHSQHTPKRTPQTRKFDPSYIEVSALWPWPFPNTPSIDLSSFRGLQLSPTSQLAFMITTKIESYYASSSGETMRTPISSENVKNSRTCILDHWAIPTPTSRSPSKSSRGA